jgi:nucleoside-diphosphate-sugar epimerase
VYLSTTGVYGPAEAVDELTLPNPQTDRDKARMETERLLSDGPWTTMVLRLAAIYGAGRGVHWSVRQAKPGRTPGSRIVSRTHVDDLAEHAFRAIQTDATGALPVADDAPCPSIEVAKWSFAYLGTRSSGETVEAPERGQKVDGTAVRALLEITLRFRS